MQIHKIKMKKFYGNRFFKMRSFVFFFAVLQPMYMHHVLSLKCMVLLDLAPACSKSVSTYCTVKVIYSEYQKFKNLIRSIFFSGVFYHFK
jgi:hypothetical protein